LLLAAAQIVAQRGGQAAGAFLVLVRHDQD
jgi:hypothetical protein